MAIRVLLVDDHAVVRHGVRGLLDQESDIEVVAEADNGRTAIGLCEQHTPDVVVMDVVMPRMNGIDATREISRRVPETNVIALSTRGDHSLVAALIASGGRGYVTKGCEVSHIVAGVRTVAAGGSFLCTRPGHAPVISTNGSSTEDHVPGPRLTPRERQVLQLLSEGHSMREIAVILGISIKTVETHRRLFTTKLGIASVAALTRYAIREGLTPL